MPFDPLRFTAFCAYLMAWLFFALGAALSWIPRLQRQAGEPSRIKPAVAAGTLLQVAAVCAITFRLDSGPLHPKPWELIAVTVLAISGSALFAWALRSAPAHDAPNQLVTHGAYAKLRHPIY